MQRVVESPLGQPTGRSAYAAARRRSQLGAVLGCIAFAAWVAFFVLPYLDETTVTTADPNAGRAGRTPLAPRPTVNAVHSAEDEKHVAVPRGGHHAKPSSPFAKPPPATQKAAMPPPPPHGARHVDPSDIRVLPPWGYNRDRNEARWKAIAASISNDLREGFTKPSGFSVVDYGADQGYFSISTAHAFPGAFVTAVELGGKGGTLWNKTAIDVHEIQEGKVAEHLGGASSSPPRINLCQARVFPSNFAKLRAAHQFHTYQYMLSVFHWFPMRSRADFERVVTDLFANARTTFIELPTIGDNGPLIRKQEGYKQWSKWYDGRTDVGDILRAAVKAQGMKATVTLVASLPWIKWERSVYRVDVQAGADASAAASQEADPFSHFEYSCEKHRAEYQCAERRKFQSCPAAASPGGAAEHHDEHA